MKEMARFAVEAQADIAFRNWVTGVTRGVFQRDYLSEIIAVLNWVRLNVRYVRDPNQFERVQKPQITLHLRSGDCDDMATLIGAAITSIGCTARYVAGAFNRDASGWVLSHVWCEGFDASSNCWVALDPVPGQVVQEMLGRAKARLVHGVEI